MPDVVQTYVDTHDIGKVVAVQNDILELYRPDIPSMRRTAISPKSGPSLTTYRPS